MAVRLNLWFNLAAAALSAVLLAFCFPFASLWWLAWFALAPWYIALDSAKGRSWNGFASGFIFGLTLHLVGMFWMTKIGGVPWAILSIIEAGWFAVMGAVVAPLLFRLPIWARPLLFAALWTLLEYARSWGSCAFPWFLLAASQVPCLPMVQIVSVTGQWGLSFAVALANGYAGELFSMQRFHKDSGFRDLIKALIATPLLVLGIGWFASSLTGRTDQSSAKVGIIQGNVGKIPENADQNAIDEYRQNALGTYLQMTRFLAHEHRDLRFILWPETVVPGYLLQDPVLHTAVSALARESHTELLVGTMDYDPIRDERFNSIVHLDTEGGVLQKYAKQRLVPMGEFFLFRNALGKIYDQYQVPNNDLTPGREPGIFTTGGSKIGMLVCYESVFPEISRDRVRQGAVLLVQATSDETFDDTPNPQQHADLAVLRAIETRRYFIRAGATGLSEVVSPMGEVLKKIPSEKAGTIVDDIALRSDTSPFVRFGDWFVSLCALITVALVAVATLRQRPMATVPAPSSEADAPAAQTIPPSMEPSS